MYDKLWLIPFFPLLGSIINGLLGKRFIKNEKVIGAIGTGVFASASLGGIGYGDGITMALAVEPSTGLIYTASGAVWSGGVNGKYGGAGGVQVFDPTTETFTLYSRDLNLRAASLAFDNDGNLWATTWPDRSMWG